ncbi:MAG TPA: hypothetical protein PLO37_18980 [Candidatus Hydrogenedentes bacterium]|nr:hypothetical protein [Candidatus Hydrogenedentota bacterium]HPG68936.1 hypothetical protein [Candidatus Hydrogenedentota bacterium]
MTSLVTGGPEWQPGARVDLLDKLKAAKAKHSAIYNGEVALSQLAREIEGVLDQAKEKKMWPLVCTSCEAYDILDPGNTKTKRYMDRAILELKRPKVKVKGFFQDEQNNDVYVFLDITLFGQKEAQTLRVRQGEEFLDPPYTLRMRSIIGNNKGVRLEYLAIEGDSFDVLAG